MSLVSIISANYNKASFISETIESVLSQTYSNWELIIVDDCSDDNSVAVINEFCSQDARIKLYVNERNRGGNFSRNKGLEKAQGDFLMFLDSDDIIVENCLHQRIEMTQDSPENNAWVSPMGVFKSVIGDCDKHMYWDLKSVDFLGDFLKHKLPWAICQPLWETTFIKGLKGFDMNFVRLQDVELHTRALLHNCVFYLNPIQSPDCYYRIDEQRIDVNQFKFLSNFSKGAMQYYSKFYPLVDEDNKKILIGTLIETISNVCYQRRIKTITKQEFKELTKALIQSCQNSKQKQLLKFYTFVEASLPIHPKGLKKIILLLS